MQLLWWAITTLVSAFVGTFLAFYLRRKGENLATHEDIAKLVEQVKAVTTATKNIEAKISQDMWDQQKRWEIKREVLFEAVRRVAAAKRALTGLYSMLKVERAEDNPDAGGWAAIKGEVLSKWNTASAELEETVLLVGVGCGDHAQQTFEDYARVVTQLAANLTNPQQRPLEDIYAEKQKVIFNTLNAFNTAIRKELEIDLVELPQGTNPSALSLP
jgi:hypothetical protein